MPSGAQRRHTTPGARSRGLPISHQQRWAQTYRETSYDQLPWFHTFPEPWLERALAERWLPSRGRWLELGCGAGTNAHWLTGQGLEVVGVDLALPAVHAAKRRLVRGSRRPSPSFVGGDVLALPFHPASFDAASDVGCFHTLPVERRPEYGREVARVLRPGGALALACFAREETKPEGPPHRPSIEEIAEALEREFIFRRLEFHDTSTPDGPGFRGYQLLLERRREPQPPPR